MVKSQTRTMILLLLLLLHSSTIWCSTSTSFCEYDCEVLQSLVTEVRILKEQRTVDRNLLNELRQEIHLYKNDKLKTQKTLPQDRSTPDQPRSTLSGVPHTDGQFLEDSKYLERIQLDVSGMKDYVQDFLGRKLATRPEVEHPRTAYSTLASKLESMRQEVLTIHLLEGENMPKVERQVEGHAEDIQRLINLTSLMKKELVDMKHRPWTSFQTDKTALDASLKDIQTTILVVGDQLNEFRTALQWTQAMTEKANKETEKIWKSIRRQSGTPKSDEENVGTGKYNITAIPIWTEESESEIDGSGSGEEGSIPPQKPTFGILDQLNRLENDHQVLSARFDELDNNVYVMITDTMARLNNVESKSQSRIESLRNSKIDRFEFKEGIKQVLAKIDQINESLDHLRRDTVFDLDVNRVAIDGIKKSAKVANLNADRALAVAKVVKRVQSDHFGELQDFKQDINEMETDVLKFGLKLTTLQADYLNSTLKLYQESRKDWDQDRNIITTQIRIEEMQEKFDDVVKILKETEGMLGEKVGYGSWKETRRELATMDGKLGQHSRFLHSFNISLTTLSDMLNRMESQIPNDCSEIHPPVTSDSVRLIKPRSFPRSVHVLCGEGGWTYLQRRRVGSENFNQSWVKYQDGFGILQQDFWIGNDLIHSLTREEEKKMQLRVDTWDIYGDNRYSDYKWVQIGSRSKNYRLELSKDVQGNLTDSFASYHNHMDFSTFDMDHDASSTHCGKYYGGGWWYSHCQKVNLNGNFFIGMTWFDNSTSDWIQLKWTDMKIRPSKLN